MSSLFADQWSFYKTKPHQNFTLPKLNPMFYVANAICGTLKSAIVESSLKVCEIWLITLFIIKLTLITVTYQSLTINNKLQRHEKSKTSTSPSALLLEGEEALGKNMPSSVKKKKNTAGVCPAASNAFSVMKMYQV